MPKKSTKLSLRVSLSDDEKLKKIAADLGIPRHAVLCSIVRTALKSGDFSIAVPEKSPRAA